MTRAKRAVACAHSKTLRDFCRLLAAMLVSCLALPVAAQVLPPPASTCVALDTAITPGSTPTQPGTWWNPSRYGTSWGLSYQENDSELTVVWYTYDAAGRPTWLMAGPAAITPEKTWSASLVRQSWSWAGGASGVQGASTPVGSVAIRFYGNDTTTAAIRWQWDGVGAGAYDECIHDFARPPNESGPQPFGVNTAFNGFWFEPGLPGYGLSLQMQQNTDVSPVTYSEAFGITIFDNAGNPVWLLAKAPDLGSAPSIGASRQLTIDYSRSGSGYSGGAPTVNCGESDGDCVITHAAVGTLTRNFTSANVGSALLAVAADQSGSNALPASFPMVTLFNRPSSGTTAVSIIKATAATQVLVDRTQCIVPAGSTSCVVTINWAIAPEVSSPSVVEFDLDTSAVTTISTARHGEIPRTLNAGRRVQYQIRQGSVVLHNSPEISALGDPIASVPDAPLTPAATLTAALGTHTATIGATPGTASVQGGAASYVIPIEAPPGRNGMQPGMSLAYDSRSGNGIAGMGWSLSGQSSIHRCPQTTAQDAGRSRAVMFDNDDRLCLDGERLIAVSGIYGRANTVYATEIDSFVRITQRGGDLNTALVFFQLRHKEGDISWYGGTNLTDCSGGCQAETGSGFAASTPRVLPVTAAGQAQTMALSWPIERRVDRFGNLLRYVYQDYGRGELLLLRAVYTGVQASTPSSVDGDRRIDVVYESRPTTTGSNDIATTFMAGLQLQQTRRIDKVITYAASVKVREYQLEYVQSAGTGRSLLESVTECATTPTATLQCREPTVLSWTHGANNYTLIEDPRINGIAGLPLDEQGDFASSVRFSGAGDFNGDGGREVLWIGPTSNSDPTPEQRLVSLGADRSVAWSLTIPAEVVGTYGGTQTDITGRADFNLDGRADVMTLPLISAGGTERKIVLKYWLGPNNATTFSAAFTGTLDTGIVVDDLRSIKFVGDMNGDGRPDIVTSRYSTSGGASCATKLAVYLNIPGPQPTSPISFVAQPFSGDCLGGTSNGNGGYFTETLAKVADITGDGIPDVWLDAAGNTTNGFSRVLSPQWQLNSGTWSATWASSTAESYFSGGRSPQERHQSLFAVWLDANGDGLEDWAYAEALSESASRWQLRLNTGKGFGPRLTSATTTGPINLGIEYCGTFPAGNSTCDDAWAPHRSGLIRVMDTDSDGRDEILVPRAFAARVCGLHVAAVNHPDCPPPSAVAPSALAAALGQPAGGVNDQCHTFYYCPEDPVTGASVPAGISLRFDANGDGLLDPTPFVPPENVRPIYERGAVGWDRSTYLTAAIEFVENGSGGVSLRRTDTAITVNENSGWSSDDIYGDGLVDAPIKTACFNDIVQGGARRCAVPYRYANGTNLPAAEYPQSLPGGLPVMSRKALLNENRGPGGVLLSDAKTPATPDVMVGAQDGLGVTNTWGYYPMSSKAGRLGEQLPLYEPASVSSQHFDADHINFTSSMPVVATMTSSDGIGGTRSWRYGYKAAVYNQKGRGFQGFKAVIEDDITASRRLHSQFHQAFPLAGKPILTTLGFLVGSNVGQVETTNYEWRCDLSNRNNTSGEGSCSKFQPGAGKFPYTIKVETIEYDKTVAQQGGTARSVPLTRREVINAPGTLNASCDFTYTGSAAGIDAYGNVAGSVTLVSDETQSVLLARHCTQTVSAFLPVTDLPTWWVDKLDTRSVTSRATYGTAHPVPSGVSNPARTIHSKYTWNTDRSLYSERVSELASPTGTTASPTRTTFYEYNTHGLPTLVRVDANNRSSAGTYSLEQLRGTVTSYTSDGYFPLQISVHKDAGNSLATAYHAVRKRDGQPGSVSDVNGLKTRMTYDSFGFVTKTEYLDAAETVHHRPMMQHALAACVGCAPGSVYKMTEVQDGAPKRVTYLDMLGRTVRQETQLLDGGTGKVGTWYDALGRVKQRTAPYRDSEAVQYTIIDDYDLADRPLILFEPRNLTDAANMNHGDLITTYTYDQRTVEAVACGSMSAAPCRSTSTTSDPFGRTVTATDAVGEATGTWYDGAGNVIALRGVDAVTTSASYDAFGHRTQVNDPNQGVWNFAYNGLGELRWQQDARGIITTFSDDWMGRRIGRNSSTHAKPVTETDNSLDTVVDTYAWDAIYARGLPAGHSRTVNGETERSQSVTYDSYARPIEIYSLQDTDGGGDAEYLHRNVYDNNFGRLKAEAWPNLASRHLIYSASGYQSEDRSPVDGTVHRRILAVDGRGQVTQETLGTLTATRTYAASTGQMLSFAYKTGSTVRRAQEYRYDLFANLSNRKLDPGVSGVTVTTETFANDVLDRVQSSTRSGGATGSVTYGYQANGNFLTKSDYSITNGYAYGVVGKSAGGNAGPHAVRQVQRSTEGGGSTVNFTYDNNGNLVAITDPSVPFAAVYDNNNLPTYTKRGAAITRLMYGADDQRSRQWGADGFHVYLDRFEDILAAGSSAPVESRAYFGDYAIFSRAANGSTTVEYLLTDRLGSVDAVASASGTISEKRGYDAFGAPRNGSTWANATPKRLTSIGATGRGYTAHEHLNSVELIHMKGRAYDYKVGRFLSVDPLIQFPNDSQSLNPYSYVMNNPLSWTDPSGFSACGIMVCPILPKRKFWADRLREEYSFSIRSGEASGDARSGQHKVSVTFLSATNGTSKQSTIASARSDSVSDGASEIGSGDRRDARNGLTAPDMSDQSTWGPEIVSALSYNKETALAYTPPSFPQWFVDGAAGVGDSLTFGLTRRGRDEWDIDGGIGTDSTEYQVGMYGAMALGSWRLAYAASVKGAQYVGSAIGGVEGARLASSGRNIIKVAARLGTFPNFRRYHFSVMAKKYEGAWAEIISASGRSNPTINAAGIAAGGGAAANKLQLCAEGDEGC